MINLNEKLQENLLVDHDSMLNLLRKTIKAIKFGTPLYWEIKNNIDDAERTEIELLLSNKF